MLNCKKYVVRLLGAFLLYGAVLIPCMRFLKENPDSRYVVPIAFLPFLPVLVIAWVAIRSVSTLDEMQRRIQFEAVVIAFVITCLTTIAYGFLQNAGFPEINLMFVGTGMIGVWGLVTFVVRKRLGLPFFGCE